MQLNCRMGRWNIQVSWYSLASENHVLERSRITEPEREMRNKTIKEVWYREGCIQNQWTTADPFLDILSRLSRMTGTTVTQNMKWTPWFKIKDEVQFMNRQIYLRRSTKWAYRWRKLIRGCVTKALTILLFIKTGLEQRTSRKIFRFRQNSIVVFQPFMHRTCSWNDQPTVKYHSPNWYIGAASCSVFFHSSILVVITP